MEFGPQARVGDEIQEQDVATILKTCVQVWSVFPFHVIYLNIYLQAAGMCVERQGTIDSIPARSEVEARMLAD